jgi:hypothetical protein
VQLVAKEIDKIVNNAAGQIHTERGRKDRERDLI